MKYLLIIVTLLMMGCESTRGKRADTVIDENRDYITYCISGVTYISGTSRAAPYTALIDTNSKVIRCEEGK